jgi:hypothetical protein
MEKMSGMFRPFYTIKNRGVHPAAETICVAKTVFRIQKIICILTIFTIFPQFLKENGPKYKKKVDCSPETNVAKLGWTPLFRKFKRVTNSLSKNSAVKKQ